MISRDELLQAVDTITNVEANFHTAIPANFRRFIYRIKLVNAFNGANVLTLGKRENGAGATTVVDYVNLAVQYDMYVDPDELEEDAIPLYIIEGAGAAGDSYIRAVMSAGNAYLSMWYVDAPA
jgi:hypothetical protein